MATLTKFCYVCKQHITIAGTSMKEAGKQFLACGHDDEKTATLQRGICGKPGSVHRKPQNPREVGK